MFEIELKFKMNGREVPFERFVEVFKQEIIQAIEIANKSRYSVWPTRPASPQPEGRPRAYSIAETALLLSLSKATVTRRIREGKIRAVHVGSRVLIPSESIQELLGNEM